MISERPAFGAMLRKLRIDAGLSQEALAERARISVQAVSALERGARRAPQRQTLDLLARALGLDAGRLVDFESAALSSATPRIRGDREAASESASIPHIPTTFVGRERERDEVAALMMPGRCTTLWGSGGIGKTRLVLETIGTLARRFPDGVRFVELAPVSDDTDVIRATAAAVGAREERGREIVDSIVRTLAGKRALLVLDNAEHVLFACATLVDRLLRDLPSLAIVATSREPLHVHGEHVYSVGPLPIPSADDPGLSSSPAIRLFLDRAAAVGAPVDGSAAAMGAVADICTRLDAIPLAIELAAARTPMMSVRQIARGLDDRFRLLTQGARTASARQKTLLEALDWSHALVSDVERVVLRRLAVWPGTWTLDDAVALADAGLSRDDVIEAVGGLVDRSLVVASYASDGDERRYSLLQTTEAYALDRAREAGELESGRRLQAERTAVLVHEGFTTWRGVGDGRALLALDVAPVRAALRWSLTLASDPHLGAILAGRATIFWDLRASPLEALRWLDEALAVVPGDDDLALAEVHIGRSRMFIRILHEQESYDAARAAIVHADRSGDPALRGTARAFLAGPAGLLGRTAEGRRALEESMTFYEQIGDERGYANVAWQRGYVAMREGDYAEAIARFEPLVAKSRENGSLTFVADGSVTLGEAEFARGNTRMAIARAEEGLTAARSANATVVEANALQNLAAYRLDLNDVAEATALARASLALTRANGYDVFTCVTIGHLAEVIAHRGHAREAAVLAGYVDERLRAAGTGRSASERRGRERLEDSFARTLGALERDAAFRDGASLSEDGAARLALDLSHD